MDYLSLAFFWYYFNVAAITTIIIFMLAIGYQRSRRVIINTAERPFKQDNSVIKLILKVAIVAIVWFVVREYGLDKYVGQFFTWASDLISEAWNG
jgi:hypothetical protein